MQQNQSGPKPGFQVAHAGAVEFHPTLFDALARVNRGAPRNFLNITHQDANNLLTPRTTLSQSPASI
jgi:hypothetical protein